MINRLSSIIILIFLFSAGCSKNNNFYGIKSDYLNGYKLSENKCYGQDNMTTYTRGRDIFEIMKIESQDNSEIINNIDKKKKQIELLYSYKRYSYPGEITGDISIEDKLKPVFNSETKDDTEYTYSYLIASNSYGIEMPIAADSTYRVLLGWIHDMRNSALFEIRIYSPLDNDFEEMKRIFLSIKASGE